MTSAVERGAENKVRGRLAEDRFKEWCTFSDITANPSKDDDEGWDFFVELKSSNAPVPFLDHAPPTVKALVQVKASADPRGEFRMKLSNARKLVTGHPGPAFVFVAYMEGRETRKTWLLHCESEFIRRVQDALCEESDAPLNERFLTFRPESADEVTRDSLRESLTGKIGDTRTYEARKRELIENVGYENGKYVLTVRSRGSHEQVLGEIVDLALGLREITADTLIINDIRFGKNRLKKEISQPILSSAGAEPVLPVMFRFETKTEHVDLEFFAISGSMVVPDLPTHLDKTLLKAPFMELVLANELSVSLKGIGEPITKTNLADRARVAKVVRLLADPSCTIACLGSSASERIVLGRGTILFNNDCMALLKVVEDYHTIVEYFGVPHERQPILPEWMLDFSDSFRAFASIARGVAEVSAAFPKDEWSVNDQVSVIHGVGLKFTSATLYVAVDVTGRVQSVDETKCRVESRTGRPLAYRVFSVEPTADELFDVLLRARKLLEDSGHENIIVFRPPV